MHFGVESVAHVPTQNNGAHASLKTDRSTGTHQHGHRQALPLGHDVTHAAPVILVQRARMLLLRWRHLQRGLHTPTGITTK